MMKAARARGFSLIEVIVAVAIVGFIGIILGGMLMRQIDAKERLEAMGERENTARATMSRLSREISMAFLSKHYNCNERRTVTLFKGKSGQNGELTFTSFSHYRWVKDANESDQNQITYTVKTDPEDQRHRALFRKESPRIGEQPNELGKDYVVAHNIDAIDYRFYNQDTDTWEDEWDTTRVEKKFRLPLFVKITLKLPFEDGQVRAFTTQTRIMLQEALAFGPNICLN